MNVKSCKIPFSFSTKVIIKVKPRKKQRKKTSVTEHNCIQQFIQKHIINTKRKMFNSSLK